MPLKREEMNVKDVTSGLVKEKCTHRYKKGFVVLDGFQFPEYMTELAPKVLNMEVRESDVWVTSYPKSGTTWTQEMVWLIANDLDYQKAKEESLESRFPFLENCALMDFEKMLSENDIVIPKGIADSFDVVATKTGKRFIKTHLPWNLLPKDIQTRAKKPKIIHVVRNAKDVCVSYYHHSKIISGYTGTFEEFFELFVEDKVMYSPYWKNISSYLHQADRLNILLLKYEDLTKDLPGEIRKVAQFMGKTLSEEQVFRLESHLSFDNMKNNASVNKEELLVAMRKLKLVSDDGTFIRSGKVGGHKAALSKEMSARLDQWIKMNAGDLKDLYP